MSKAPYRHSDGSDCYTKNCSRGHHTSADTAVMKGDVNAYIDAREQEENNSSDQNAVNERDRILKQIYNLQNEPEFTIQVAQDGRVIKQLGAPNKLFAQVLKKILQKNHPEALIFIWPKR